jgi:leader peptidase (prepilin peptidase)/N-methyltransferase
MQNVFDLVCYLILTWGLIVIFFIDLEHQIIPDEILLPLIVLFSIRQIFLLFSLSPITYPLSPTFSAIGAFLFLFIIYLVTKGKGMGFGDVKFAFLMGLVLGYPKIIVAFYLAFLTGALVGIILILGRKAKFGQKIAFGPFLALSTIISFLWGDKILSLALKILL